jgi:hypothetical protein
MSENRNLDSLSADELLDLLIGLEATKFRAETALLAKPRAKSGAISVWPKLCHACQTAVLRGVRKG